MCSRLCSWRVIQAAAPSTVGGTVAGLPSKTDVADRITKKLIEDFERAKKLPAVNPAASGTSTH
jgi:hypothetical protein